MDTSAILKQAEKIVLPILGGLGYELIEREFVNQDGRFVLRLYIDKESGNISLDDCERVTHAVEDLLEVELNIPVAHSLEISSPGVNRPLRYLKDFKRYRGSRIRLLTLYPLEGRKNYQGILEGVEADQIVMSVDGQRYLIPYESLSRANIIGVVVFS